VGKAGTNLTGLYLRESFYLQKLRVTNTKALVKNVKCLTVQFLEFKQTNKNNKNTNNLDK